MARRIVVDGSNIATEGRSLPSLAQLDEAVRAYQQEHPDDEIIVVVDASFEHRIDQSERQTFDEAEDAGEIVSPPAGAIGRGDGFLLQVADRIGATVLSNDSFQEFHGTYDWLFEEGRLVGGKPVPGVGWIFTPRTPVRGPKSRVSLRQAGRRGQPRAEEPVAAAIAEATQTAMEPDDERSGRRRRRRGRREPSEPVNEPLPFISFIAEHRLGSEVEGVIDTFTSHGAFVTASGARCYVPLTALGDPPPRSARDILRRGESQSFVVQAFDPPRRGIELALPGLAHVAGAPTAETVEAEIREAGPSLRSTTAVVSGTGVTTGPAGEEPIAAALATDVEPAPPSMAAADEAVAVAASVDRTAARRGRGTKATATKAAATKKAATKAPTPKSTTKKAPAKRLATKKVASKKTVAKKAVPRKAAAKAAAPKVATRKAAAKTATKKAATRKAPAKKSGAPAANEAP